VAQLSAVFRALKHLKPFAFFGSGRKVVGLDTLQGASLVYEEEIQNAL
jgi:hypothetical protein